MGLNFILQNVVAKRGALRVGEDQSWNPRDPKCRAKECDAACSSGGCKLARKLVADSYRESGIVQGACAAGKGRRGRGQQAASGSTLSVPPLQPFNWSINMWSSFF